jgi:hypothetical protein
MISIYLLDLKRSENETEKITSKLSDKLSKRIFETKNKERQKERAFSYLLAEYLIKSAYPCDEKREITFLPSGKPIVKNTDLSISVTHSGELAAVAVYNKKGAKIGIDIQEITEDNLSVAQKFFNRYPISLDGYENGNEKIDIFYAEISKRDGNISLTDKRAHFTSAEKLSEIDNRGIITDDPFFSTKPAINAAISPFIYTIAEKLSLCFCKQVVEKSKYFK